MSELKAQMGASEAVDGDGQLDHFTPARAVVVVENKWAVFTDIRLSWAQANTVLKKKKVQSIVLGSDTLLHIGVYFVK